MDAYGRTYVFMDQSGDASLKTDSAGSSRYYVVAATISDASEISNHWQQAQGIISKHCGVGELKSSTIGNNSPRRDKILSDLSETDIRAYCLVVDKSDIQTESGLRYKRTFYKFLNRTVVARLGRPYSELEIVADNQGSDEFMEGFRSYIETRAMGKLFETSSFRFEDSKTLPLIQIADLIAGTLARVYDQKDPDQFLKKIRRNLVLVEEWPPALRASSIELSDSAHGQFDLLVRDQAVRQARDYIIENSSNDDPIERARVAFVKFLLHWFTVVSPASYVSTDRIRDYLKETTGFDGSEQLFRSRIVGHLRDSGVIVTSSSRGFKIPNSQKDIRKYVQLVDGQILPYLRRMLRTRNLLLLASKGEYDIVDAKEFPELNAFLKDSNT